MEYGIIRLRRQGLSTADIRLTDDNTVTDESTITISEKYRANGNAAEAKNVFTGRIDSVDYNDSQKIKASGLDAELDQIFPSGLYGGYTETLIGRMINDEHNGQSLQDITCTQSSGNVTLALDGDISSTNWSDANGNNNGVMFDDLLEGIGAPDGSYIFSQAGTPDLIMSIADAHGLSATYHYSIYKIEVKIRSGCASPPAILYVDLYDGAKYVGEQSLSVTAWNTETFTFNLKLYSEEDIANFRLRLRASEALLYVDTVDVIFYYYYYPDLVKGSVTNTHSLGGDLSIRQVLDKLCLEELYTWYVNPDLKLLYDDGATVSGVSLVATDKMKGIVGTRQVKSYDKVVLYGAYSGGARISSTSGAGNIIWKDTYHNIDTQAGLDALAAQVLIEQGSNAVRVQLMRYVLADGVYQVGETVAVAAAAAIKFSNSDREIPDDRTYIINKIDYYIVNGVYSYLDIELIDGLLFSLPKDDTNASGQNSLAINQVAGGESVGEANTASNIGTDGVGVYDSKSGVTLQFRNIAPASANITITENGDDIDIDVADKYLKNDAADTTTGDLTVPNLICAGLVDGEDVSALATDLALQCTTAEAHAHIEATALTLTALLTMSGANIEMAGAETVDGKDVSTLCTTAEAIQAVEDIGLVLSATKVITSADADLTFQFGRCKLHGDTDVACFGHTNFGSKADCGMFIDATGKNTINTNDATQLDFAVHSVVQMNMTTAGLQIGAGARVTTILDEDAMGTDSATALATQQSIKAYADLKCTTAEAHAHIEATALTLTALLTMSGVNIEMAGAETVDGIDISAISITNMPTAVNNWKLFCTNGTGIMTEIATGAAATVLTGNGVAAAPTFQAAGGAGATEADILVNEHVGVANLGNISLIAEIDHNTTSIIEKQYGGYLGAYVNTDNADGYLMFGFPLPMIKTLFGTDYYLHINKYYIGLDDADAGDYLDASITYKWTDFTTRVQIATHNTNYTSAQLVTIDYSAAPLDLQGAVRMAFTMKITSTAVLDFDCSFVNLEYYYDT